MVRTVHLRHLGLAPDGRRRPPSRHQDVHQQPGRPSPFATRERARLLTTNDTRSSAAGVRHDVSGLRRGGGSVSDGEPPRSGRVVKRSEVVDPLPRCGRAIHRGYEKGLVALVRDNCTTVVRWIADPCASRRPLQMPTPWNGVRSTADAPWIRGRAEGPWRWQRDWSVVEAHQVDKTRSRHRDRGADPVDCPIRRRARAWHSSSHALTGGRCRHIRGRGRWTRPRQKGRDYWPSRGKLRGRVSVLSCSSLRPSALVHRRVEATPTTGCPPVSKASARTGLAARGVAGRRSTGPLHSRSALPGLPTVQRQHVGGPLPVSASRRFGWAAARFT